MGAAVNTFEHQAMSGPGSPPLFPSMTDAVRHEEQLLVANHVASMRPPRARPGMILGFLGAIAAVVTVLLVAFLGGPWSPEEAALDFTDAMGDQDFEEAWELLCREQHERYDSSLMNFMVRNTRLPGEGRSIGGIELADDARWDEGREAYIVPMRSTWPAERMEAQLLVIEEDGEYRVCGAAVDAGR